MKYLTDLYRPMENMLSQMNNKDRSSNTEISERELRQFMTTVQEDKTFEKTIQDMFEVAGATFIFLKQLMALQTLLLNPRDFAENLVDDRTTKNFKADPNQREKREFLFSHIITDQSNRRRQEDRGRSTSLWSNGKHRSRSRSPDTR